MLLSLLYIFYAYSIYHLVDSFIGDVRFLVSDLIENIRILIDKTYFAVMEL